ncbi:MAG: SlyX family protein [Burkholderiales bacterium]|jgi:SlyX protein
MTPEEIDRRLTALEEKASLTEDLVERLDEIVIAQQTTIDSLRRELARLALERRGDGDGEAGARSLRDELPPHY